MRYKIKVVASHDLGRFTEEANHELAQTHNIIKIETNICVQDQDRVLFLAFILYKEEKEEVNK